MWTNTMYHVNQIPSITRLFSDLFALSCLNLQIPAPCFITCVYLRFFAVLWMTNCSIYLNHTIVVFIVLPIFVMDIQPDIYHPFRESETNSQYCWECTMNFLLQNNWHWFRFKMLAMRLMYRTSASNSISKIKMIKVQLIKMEIKKNKADVI